MTNYLSDDELLNVPIGNLHPGELARAFAVEVMHVRKVEEVEAERSVTLAARRQQQDEATQEEEHEIELHQREAFALTRVEEQETELRTEAVRQDERAIKLADGRRAYVDGDKYRDENGRELKGADRAQAEVEHSEHPDATTWQEHETLVRKWEQTETLRTKIEALQANGGPDAGSELTAYEKQLQSMRDADLAKSPALPNYGTGDYATDLSGLISTYKAPKPN